MGISGFVAKAVGKFVLKTGLKKAYVKTKRWYFHNIRGEKTPVEKLQQSAKKIEQLEEQNRVKDFRLESKEAKIEEREDELSEVQRNLSLKERLIESLEIKGISRQELYKKNLDDPTPFLIIRTGGQKPRDDEGKKWVKQKLKQQFGAETVGSSYVIPPEHFPDELTQRKLTLSKWMERETKVDGKNANFVYVAWVDLAQGQLYWREDYESRSPMKKLEDRFDMAKYVNKDFYDFDEVKDALQLIKKGDIAFFSAKFVNEEEIRDIHDDQADIEEELDNPSLKELATKVEINDICNSLLGYVADPENVAQGVKSEAEIWYDELYQADEVEVVE